MSTEGREYRGFLEAILVRIVESQERTQGQLEILTATFNTLISTFTVILNNNNNQNVVARAHASGTDDQQVVIGDDHIETQQNHDHHPDPVVVPHQQQPIMRPDSSIVEYQVENQPPDRNQPAATSNLISKAEVMSSNNTKTDSSDEASLMAQEEDDDTKLPTQSVDSLLHETDHQEINRQAVLDDNQDHNHNNTNYDSLLQKIRERYRRSRGLHPQLRLRDFTGNPTIDSTDGIQVSPDGYRKSILVAKYEALCEAASSGDWEWAREFFEANPEAVTARIDSDSRTALWVAAGQQKWMFVEELLKLMPPEELELQDPITGCTVLHYAAVSGKKKIAEAIVKKNPNLTQLRVRGKGAVPLLVAAMYVSDGQKDTVEYLYTVTKDEGGSISPFSGPYGACLICAIIEANYYDIALSLVGRFPNLVFEKAPDPYDMCALEVLSERPFVFLSGSQLTSWQRCIYSLIKVDHTSHQYYIKGGDVENPTENSNDSPTRTSRGRRTIMTKFLSVYLYRVPGIKQLYNQKLMHNQASALVKSMFAELDERWIKSFDNSNVLKTAIKYGTTEVAEECISNFSYLVWEKIKNQRMIEIAIEERNEKVLNLILESREKMNDKNELVSRKDDRGNGILHYAAKLAPSPQLNSVSGAALQMQREMQWFKGVENIVLEKDRLKRNRDGKTAQFLFTEEHKDLVKEGEKWMKDTSGSCMLVATLIATVVFAAAFTVPGGNISDINSPNNGIPIFLYKNSFIVFAVADAFALFSSITSVLMFLAILTSRFSGEDFLKTLPQKLIIGLATLFFSIATMMIAFGAALAIVLGHRLAWVSIPIALLACVPVTLFALLQFPLFFEMVRSTYWPTIFRKKSKCMEMLRKLYHHVITKYADMKLSIRESLGCLKERNQRG